MDALSSQGNCWPTPQQEQLLKACLLEGKAGVKAWEAWIEDVVDIGDLDHGSFRLLPLLYKNLRRNGVQAAELPKLKGVYRQTWFQNQMTFHQVRQPLEALYEAGIPALLLKGSALILTSYQDYGARPIGDFDFLVPWEQTFPAISLIEKQGWVANPCYPVPLSKIYLSRTHALILRKDDQKELELHWNLQPEHLDPDVDADLWVDAVRADLNGIPVYTLSPTDAFFHVCVHGVRWDPVPPLRWVADAYTILQKTPHLDWNRLLAQGKKRQLVLPLREAIVYLVDLLAVDIPHHFLAQLQQTPIPKAEERAYQIRIHPTSVTPELSGPVEVFSTYVRQVNFVMKSYLQSDSTQQKSLIGFLRLLQEAWGVPHLWLLPSEILIRSTRVGWKMTARLRRQIPFNAFHRSSP